MDNINYTLKIMKILKFKNTAAEIICQIASTALEMSNERFSDLELRSIEIAKSNDSYIVRKQIRDCLGPGTVIGVECYANGYKEILGCDGNISYLDFSGYFTIIYIFINSSNCSF